MVMTAEHEDKEDGDEEDQGNGVRVSVVGGDRGHCSGVRSVRVSAGM